MTNRSFCNDLSRHGIGVMNNTVKKSILGVSSFIDCCLMARFPFKLGLTKSLCNGWMGVVGETMLGSAIGIFSSCAQNPTRISIQEYFLLRLYFSAI
jgi:hypothetical protein